MVVGAEPSRGPPPRWSPGGPGHRPRATPPLSGITSPATLATAFGPEGGETAGIPSAARPAALPAADAHAETTEDHDPAARSPADRPPAGRRAGRPRLLAGGPRDQGHDGRVGRPEPDRARGGTGNLAIGLGIRGPRQRRRRGRPAAPGPGAGDRRSPPPVPGDGTRPGRLPGSRHRHRPGSAPPRTCRSQATALEPCSSALPPAWGSAPSDPDPDTDPTPASARGDAAGPAGGPGRRRGPPPRPGGRYHRRIGRVGRRLPCRTERPDSG